jgi:predicted metal-binding protein
MKNTSFRVRTSKQEYNIEVYSEFIAKEEVKVERELFIKMCREGCKNYGKKFSCPPCSWDFLNIISGYEGIFVVMFLIKLEEINSTEYNKVRIANSIMKSRIDRVLRLLEEKFNTKFLSTGSCRLCRTCNLKLKKPCKHPDKMRYSLESSGVNCDYLSTKLFNKPLLWFKNKKAPEYTCVIGGLIYNKEQSAIILQEFKDILNKN